MKIEIGGGFLATLTIIFVIAKILGYISWSWWVVFLPILIGVSIPIFIILIIFVMIIIMAIVEALS